MRHVWPSDHLLDDLFDSPSFGMLWLKGVDMVQVIEDSRQAAADIIGTTPAAILAEETERMRRMLS